MLKQRLSSFFSRRHLGLYGMVSLMIALSVIMVTPQVSYGIPWLDIIRRGVQVIQLSNISDRQEVQLGRQINQGLIQQGRMKPVSNQAINNYINQIGQRLARTSKRPNIPYTFQVVRDDQINAFATMGGFVYLNTGLIKAAANEAELASVVAHEIGHIVGRHSIKQLKNAAISQGLMTAAGLERNTIVNLGVQLGVQLPNSREDELEADRYGLQNLKRVGYAPSAMLTFMQKLLRQSGATPAFLSTHPSAGNRLQAIRNNLNPATANQGGGLDSQAYKAAIRSLY